MSKTELTKGRNMRRKLLGDAYVDHIAATTYKDPLMRKFLDVASETVFGALWTRPGLDLKTRTLITVISDASTGREPELAIHLRMARRQGWSENELAEAILHLLGYVGAPLVRDAMLVATKVFAELREEASKA
jgi:4-carboxymuconolactone decarboxylase